MRDIISMAFVQLCNHLNNLRIPLVIIRITVGPLNILSI